MEWSALLWNASEIIAQQFTRCTQVNALQDTGSVVSLAAAVCAAGFEVHSSWLQEHHETMRWRFSALKRDEVRAAHDSELTSPQQGEGLLRKRWEHAQVCEVLNIVVGCSLGWVSCHRQHVLEDFALVGGGV